MMGESISVEALHADSPSGDVIAHIQQHLDQLKAERGTLRVLEAGCGSASVLRFEDDDWMVGIDISEEQLARNTRLNDSILGDICAHELDHDTYDVIVCWNVLEHIDKPDLAVLNFARALKPGGLLLLALPNVYSLQGAVVRFSPHWFHVWFVRNIFRRTCGARSRRRAWRASRIAAR
jgi:SAM-dependent methyltransferase